MSNTAQEEKKVLSITEAAKLSNVTRQAIYVAIKLKKLKAQKDTTRWTINMDDLEEYRKYKYSRSRSRHNGELIFDKNKGYFSVNEAASILSVPAQKIYYATRIGALKAHRRGAAWVIHMEDLKAYAKQSVENKEAASQAVAS